VFNFYLNQVLQFALADGSGALLDGGDTTTVIGWDPEGGTVTIADTLDVKIAGITTSAFVFTAGDFNACLSGLGDWMPVDNRAAALAATFNGVVRTQSPVYLGGVVMDGTAMGSLDEVMIKLAGKVGKYGGMTDLCLANNESLSDLELVTNSRIRVIGSVTSEMRSDTTGEVIVGFSGYKIMVGGRTIDVYPDRNCPSSRLFMLQLDTWTLFHTGEMINWLGESYTGHRLQPSQNDDAAEARLGGYQNLGCGAPGHNAVAKINPSN
jgi:hypothetical protein